MDIHLNSLNMSKCFEMYYILPFHFFRLTVSTFAKFINSQHEFFQYFDEVYQNHCRAFKKDWAKESVASYVNAVCTDRRDGYIILEVSI